MTSVTSALTRPISPRGCEGLSFHGLSGLASAFAAAQESGLLVALVAAPATAEEYAAQLHLDAPATRLVLAILASIGLVTEKPRGAAGTVFQASDELRAADAGMPGGLALSTRLWAHTRTFLASGVPLTQMNASAVEREKAYREVVGDLARFFCGPARDLAAIWERPPSRILDIGCGSGVFGLAFAERYLDSQVTGLDFPSVLDVFEKRARDLGLFHRTRRLAGDMHDVEIPTDFDLVLIANVLRLETPEKAQALVRKAARALVPGGELVVLDALASGSLEKERARAIYALHLALRTENASVPTEKDVREWLESAGLVDIRAIALPPHESALGAMTGRKPPLL